MMFGSTLSSGTLWIVIGIAVVAIATVVTLTVVAKKKKNVAKSDANKETED